MCWHLYAVDSGGKLALNKAETRIATTGSESWIAGGAKTDDSKLLKLETVRVC